MSVCVVNIIFAKGEFTKTWSLSATSYPVLSLTVNQVPLSVIVYSLCLAASVMASKGKLENILYHEVGGSAHGTWPMMAHRKDSTMFPADLSYLNSKATIISSCRKNQTGKRGRERTATRI